MNATPDRKTFTVLGATSDTGAIGAFAGADGAYLTMPFDLRARDLHSRERAGQAFAEGEAR